MSERNDNGVFLSGVALGLACATILLTVNRGNDRKTKERQEKQQKMEQEKSVQDSLQNTIEYKEAMKAYKKMVRKQQEIESGFGKNK